MEAKEKAGKEWAWLTGYYDDTGGIMISPVNADHDTIGVGDYQEAEWDIASPVKTRTEPVEIDSTESSFIRATHGMAGKVHETALMKGWWDTPRSNGEVIALIHSEISEALEALRHGNPPDDKIPEFWGAEAELADAIIRILDFGKERGWRIPEAVVAKNHYNQTRPHRHGKAF